MMLRAGWGSPFWINWLYRQKFRDPAVRMVLVMILTNINSADTPSEFCRRENARNWLETGSLGLAPCGRRELRFAIKSGLEMALMSRTPHASSVPPTLESAQLFGRAQLSVLLLP